jgi:hypothetical protein
LILLRRTGNPWLTTGFLGIGIGLGSGNGVGDAAGEACLALVSSLLSLKQKQELPGKDRYEKEIREGDLPGEKTETGDPSAAAHASPKSFPSEEKKLNPAKPGVRKPAEQPGRHPACPREVCSAGRGGSAAPGPELL